MRASGWAVALGLLAVACASSGGETGESSTRPPLGTIPAEQDILTTDLQLDLSALTGRAELGVVPAPGSGVVAVDVRGLTLDTVTVEGEAVEPRLEGGIATVPVPEGVSPVNVVFTYAFPTRTLAQFDGWMPDQGVSFLWPNYCGNLFPCNPAPADGVTFTLDVTGIPEGKTAVFPTTTTSDTPSYQPGIAVADYDTLDLGTTTAGTHLTAWYFSGKQGLTAAQAGTAHFRDAWDFYEQTYGPYSFGPEGGTVEVDWGADSWGGMEHHPFVHVAKFDFEDEEAQLHEIAHAWFGDGVRLRCWEDFVLSEGTTTYIAARASETVGGPDFWSYYVDDFLAPICNGHDVNAVVYPDTCNTIDFENSDVWSLATYMKGACFYEDVADLVGQDVTDAAIADFYQTHQNGAASMSEMIDTLKAHAPAAQAGAIDALVSDWLTTEECPTDWEARCRSHQR